MATHDENPLIGDTRKTKVRRAKEHPTGIIVPRWWRGNAAIVVGVVAVVSVVFAALTLDQASERVSGGQGADTDAPGKVAQPAESKAWYKSQEPPPDLPRDAVAKLFPTQEETPGKPAVEKAGEDPVRAYEETLPSDLYEEAPVIADASGPRVTIPEEYIPETNNDTLSPAVSPAEPTGGTDQLARLSPPNTKDTDTSSDIDIKPFEQALLEPAPAWLANAIAFPPTEDDQLLDRPMIAIVIDDVGVDQRRAPRAIALPGPLTLSFLTYARNLDVQTRAAMEAGHELMVHIPMEPSSHTVDPGPNVLRVEDSAEQTLERLRWGLAQFEGYVGLNNHMGSKFTQDNTGVRTVLEEVGKRGLLFLDSRTAAGSVAAGLAQELGVPFATRNVFLDHVDDEDEIRHRLAQTERLARKNGAVVAIGHPHDTTLKVLEEWLPTVADKGLMLVPISELVRRTWLKEK